MVDVELLRLHARSRAELGIVDDYPDTISSIVDTANRKTIFRKIHHAKCFWARGITKEPILLFHPSHLARFPCCLPDYLSKKEASSLP
jgi:hypothetical protein